MRMPATRSGAVGAAVGAMAVVAMALAASCTTDDRSGAPRRAAPGSASTTSPPSSPTTSADAPNIVAQVKGSSIPVFAGPGDPTAAFTLANPNEDGAPRVFLVKSQSTEWLEVLLPIRPAGSRGWVRLADVSLTRHDYKVRVELGAHRITVVKGGEVVLQEPIGVGVANAPTPDTEYYITQLLQPPDPNGPYGAYAYGLSGYSDVLKSLAGGNTLVGIHGTNEPESLGRDLSAGSIRMSNQSITRLAGMLPLGTPVAVIP